jgi:hypothetical protein
LISNILGTGQQLWYMKQHGPANLQSPGPNAVKVEDDADPKVNPFSTNGSESGISRNGTKRAAKAGDGANARPKVHPKKKRR